MFLCTGNSCRSQMAEGFARKLGRGLIEPYSAGLIETRVHPRALEVMREEGIDISAQHSKLIDEDLLGEMDVVITLCPYAEAMCPAFPSDIVHLHWPIEDPVGTTGSEKQILREFRRARDQIKAKIEDFVKDLATAD
jgi:arsenate reductase (thioredoxin)